MTRKEKAGALFRNPDTSAQRRYEAVRAYFIDDQSPREVAERFGYSYGTVRNLCSDVYKTGKLPFFLPDRRGRPKSESRQAEPSADQKARKRAERTQRILELRRQDNLSAAEIAAMLQHEGFTASESTVSKTLRAEGVPRLHRRTLRVRLDAPKPGVARVANHRLLDLRPRRFETRFGGIFLFLHDLARIEFDTLLQQHDMPGSEMVPAGCAVRALLALKLWGSRRHAHDVMAEVIDEGPALFAGLNCLPKRSTLTEYSARIRAKKCRSLMDTWDASMHALGIDLGPGQSFDLDFQTIPFHGHEALIEKQYAQTRSRSQLGILSLLARDADSRLLVYGDATVQRKDRSDQVLRFIEYREQHAGTSPEELVFDKTFTTHANLNRLTVKGVRFLTVRRRAPSIIKAVEEVPDSEWVRVRLPNHGRALRNPQVYDTEVEVRGHKGTLRQLAVKDFGQEGVTLLLTNHMEVAPAKLLDRYARCMRTEDTLADAVEFFHLDALSGAVPLRVEVDLQLTRMASTLYRILAVRAGHGLETASPRTVFRKLVRSRGRVEIRKDDIIVTLVKRASNAPLMAAGYAEADERIPWLCNKRLRIRFQ